MERRDFLKLTGLAGLGLTLGAAADTTDRPNILWLSAEDISPLLGCYGDTYAHTPNLDQLAHEGVRYDRAYAPVPVCSPSRSCVITGVHPVTLGTSHHRSFATLPQDLRCFPAYLRDAGYYCTNNSKKDYNFQEADDTWDESSRKAHWRNRPEDRPFFAVINHTVCHESVLHRDERTIARMRNDYVPSPHDPAKAPIPAYHPDLPAFREDWALYYDSVTAMDAQVGERLRELKEAGLAENTIVVFWGDHGTGITRGKRWIHESGTRIPLIVRVPEKYAHLAPGPAGSVNGDFVTFQDFAPTMLALAGVPRPRHMQGRVFFGTAQQPAPESLYFSRDRLDESCDTVRAVREKRYRYIRNYLPHVPYDQLNLYLYKAKSVRAWHEAAGTLEGPPAIFADPRKSMEELYDVETDPDEVNNLAQDPAHLETLQRMRVLLEQKVLATRDTGLLAEAQLAERTEGRPAYAFAQDREAFDLPRILAAANLPLEGDAAVPKLLAALEDQDDAVRYWGVIGLIALQADSDAVHAGVRKAASDASDGVRIAAMEALCSLGDTATGIDGLLSAAVETPTWPRVRALNALERQGAKAERTLETLETLTQDKDLHKEVKRAVDAAIVRIREAVG